MPTCTTLWRLLETAARWGCVILLLALAPPPAASANQQETEQTATEAVKGTITALIRVLDDNRLKQPDRAEQRRRTIEELIRSRVDYEEMAKRALGAPWQTLSERERLEFVGLFVHLLRDTFAGRITEHHDEQIDYLGEHREDAYAEVRTRLKGRKTDTSIDFRLIDRAGRWRVYDVVIDGAGIVSNYRAQFTNIIREASYAGLVNKMKQKAVAVKIFETAPAP